MRALLVAVVSLALGHGAARAESRQYALDPKASRIAIHVGKEGLLGFAGHERDVVVGSFRGKVIVDGDQIERSSLNITIAAASLRVIGKGQEDVSGVQAKMVGPKCLDVVRFPGIRFVSKAVSIGGATGSARDLAIRGDLTLHGVTREITVSVRLELAPDSLEATGGGTLRQSDFGITPISIARVIKVRNELGLSFRIVGRRRASLTP